MGGEDVVVVAEDGDVGVLGWGVLGLGLAGGGGLLWGFLGDWEVDLFGA